MKVRLKLRPGQKGTKALVEKYGDALVCVRYRYDEASRIRTTTAELVEEKKHLPPARPGIANDAPVPVRIAYGEKSLGQLARSWPGNGMRMSSCGTFRTGKSRGRNLRGIWSWMPNERAGAMVASNSRYMPAAQSGYRHLIVDALPESGRCWRHLIVYALRASNIRCRDIILDANVKINVPFG